MIRFLNTLLILGSLALSLQVKSQNGNSLEKFDLTDGLSSNKVFMTLEDEQGFIWIATDRGIDRFDGREIKNYKLDKINEIRRVNFVALFIDFDSEGRLWVLSNNGILQYYDPVLDQFTFYDQLSSTPTGSIYVNAFLASNSESLLIGSFNGVLNYNPDKKESYLIEGVNGSVSSILECDDSYFIGGKNGIYKLNEELKLIENLKSKDPLWIDDFRRIDALYLQESENRLWIGTSEKGLYYYDLNHNQLSRMDNDLGGIDVPIRSINSIGSDLWIGTDGSGVYVFDALSLDIKTSLAHDPDDPVSISSNSVYHIFQNSQNVTFIATYRGGLNIYNPFKQNFRQISHELGNKNSLVNDVVLSLAEIQSRYISFGTDQGISLWNQQNETWTHFKSDATNQSGSPVVLNQKLDAENNLWVASFNAPLQKLSVVNGKFSKLKAAIPDELINEKIKALCYHSSGDLLVGTTNGGLYIINDQEVRNISIGEPLIIEEYSPTKVLIGNREGLSSYDLKYQELEKIDLAIDNESNPVVVGTLLLDHQNNIWVGTNDQGIIKLNLSQNSKASHNIENGLSSNDIYSMIEDNTNQIWVTTSAGVSKIIGSTIQNFYPSDGLPTIDFNRNVSLLDESGNVYFGTNQGAIVFNLSEITSVEYDKTIILTDFFLDYKRVDPNKKGPLNLPLHFTDEISLKHDQNSFAIGFTNVDFVNRNLGEFKWQLEGFDKEWISQANATRASYTNLESGDYTFRIHMVDPTGKQISQERIINLSIGTPYWQTPWAFMIYALIAAGLLVSILYLNKLRLETSHAEDQLHLLMDMAHEIKTPLTLIKAPLTDLINNNKVEDEIKETLNVSLKSADKLHKQMLQFLDFRKLSAQKESLFLDVFDIIALVKAKIFAFKVLAERKSISIEFVSDFDEYEVVSDENMLDRVISNLLSNAIKYTKEEGTIKLIFENKTGMWQLKVVDSGIGISKKDQKKIFKLFYRTKLARESGNTGSGVGLILARDLTHTLGGKLILESSSHTGSVFSITLPIVHPNVAKGDKPIERIKKKNEKIAQLENEKPIILLVEDDEELRNYEKTRLSIEYNVILADNGQMALQMLEDTLPDLIISDVNMPKMNGRQLCMNVKSDKKTSHIPVILLTGLESKENVKQGLESGADDYIVKPFDFELLVSKINNLFESRKAFRNRFLNESEEVIEYEIINSELDQDFIKGITTLIEDNLSDTDLTPNFLCESVGMSRTTFYHKLKAIVDLSPADFIRTIRLKEAKKLLLNPTMNISEVAYSTGFMDAKYFATVFKKYYGKSPSSYVSEHTKKV